MESTSLETPIFTTPVWQFFFELNNLQMNGLYSESTLRIYSIKLIIQNEVFMTSEFNRTFVNSDLHFFNFKFWINKQYLPLNNAKFKLYSRSGNEITNEIPNIRLYYNTMRGNDIIHPLYTITPYSGMTFWNVQDDNELIKVYYVPHTTLRAMKQHI